MTTILHILPDIGINGAARQLSLLAPHWRRMGVAVHVAPMRRATLEMPIDAVVHQTAGRGWVDPRRWLQLRRTLRAEPFDVVHAWRIAPPLLAAVGAAAGRGPRLIATDSPASWRGLSRRWRQVDDVSLAVEAPAPIDRAALLTSLRIPLDARLIACAGRMDRGRGFIDAVWVFDILKYVYPNHWLLVIGDGPQRARVEEFGRSLGREDFRVRFAGARVDAPALLQLAEVVWVLGERGGRNVALEALAAGRAVVARQRADLESLIGPAGLYVPRADRHETARATRRLLDDPAMMEKCMVAGKERLSAREPEAIARQWLMRYS